MPNRRPPRAAIPSVHPAVFAATLAAILAVVAAAPTSLRAQAVTRPGANGRTFRSPTGATLRLILDDSTVGPAVSMGELTFPPNIDSGEHSHGSTEILYVLEGSLEHTVDGKTTVLTPGMTGYVRPPGKIRHKTGPAGAKVLVIWAPGEEAARITARWTREP